jgi:hypothetical protein
MRCPGGAGGLGAETDGWYPILVAMDLSRVIQAVLSRVHEREGYVTKTKLLKYLYLFDLETYRRTGRALTGFEWIFHLYGPWAPQYDGLYADLVRSGGLRVTPGTRPELDTEFLSSPRRVELQDVVGLRPASCSPSGSSGRRQTGSSRRVCSPDSSRSGFARPSPRRLRRGLGGASGRW